MSDDRAVVLDMLKAARRASEFLASASKAAFLVDAKLQSAVVFQLPILGEAAKRVTPAFRQVHPEVSWKMIAGMRDQLSHGYNDIDLEEVWKTASSDVPGLIARLEPVAEREAK